MEGWALKVPVPLGASSLSMVMVIVAWSEILKGRKLWEMFVMLEEREGVEKA